MVLTSRHMNSTSMGLHSFTILTPNSFSVDYLIKITVSSM
uniref:Uncharacterized protein n=1 Tax=Rhizophora mucronata TaxID=61149 RepID=A0A2P2LFN8_RHIMU